MTQKINALLSTHKNEIKCRQAFKMKNLKKNMSEKKENEMHVYKKERLCTGEVVCTSKELLSKLITLSCRLK